MMAEIPVGTRTDECITAPAETSANGSHSSPASSEQVDEVERLRGVVALPYPREILFTDEVALTTDRLPRWQPQIIVDERRLLDDEHE
jgi:hypothetical protein